MIPYKAGPLIELPIIKIWGVMVAIAFLVALYLAIKEAKKRKIEKEHIYNIFFYILIGFLVGARLAYVLEYWNSFANLIDVFKIWQGGVSFFGGLIGSLLLSYIYIRKNKLNFWLYADICAPSIAIGHAIGRLGCILGDGGHIGKLTTMPWGAMVNGEVRHLTALYSFIFLITLFIFLYKLKDKKVIRKRTGSLFLIYLFSYSIGRFVIDLFRIDPRYYGLTLTQLFLIAIFLISSILLYRKWKK